MPKRKDKPNDDELDVQFVSKRKKEKTAEALEELDSEAEELGSDKVASVKAECVRPSPYPRKDANWPFLDSADPAETPCAGVDDKTYMLQPYSQKCKQGKTGHHLIPDRTMWDTDEAEGEGGQDDASDESGKTPRLTNYVYADAPVICVKGKTQHKGNHKKCHAAFDPVELAAHESGEAFTYEAALDAAVASAGALGASDDEMKCVRHQLSNYYEKTCDAVEATALRASGKPGKVIPKTTLKKDENA